LYTLLLPQSLDDAIQGIEFTSIQRNHAYNFIRFLLYLNHISEDEYVTNSFINISSKKLRKEFTRSYKPMFLEPLIKSNIIKRSFYSNSSAADKFKGKQPKRNHPFGYKINEDLLDYSVMVSVSQGIKADSRKKQQKTVVKDLSLLEVDIQGMVNYVNDYDISCQIVVIDDITEDDIELIDSKNLDEDGHPCVYIIKSADALAKAKTKNLDLIFYKNKYYISNIEQFKRVKLNHFKTSQLHAITALQNKDYYASINDTNGRLDTNLTNLKSDFIRQGFIKLDGEEITDTDLKNSQPCLLAYLITDIEHIRRIFPSIINDYEFPTIDAKTADFALFVEKAGNGEVYDYICQQTGWDRNLAKNNFIRIMFSKARWNPPYKKKLKVLFPTLISWMDAFKVMNADHTQLAIMLQKIEAEIFISDIYYSLKREGYVIFSKHDSILCKASQKAEIKEKMEEILNQYGFAYKLK